MNKPGVNVPVLIIFFNRPDTLKNVFEAVRKARPSVLFLAQDGARENRENDISKIQECRKIVEEIDWDCTFYRDYSPINLTCDHREYTAIDWAFSKVDRLIVLEDDCVPCDSFFPFCEELLEKYRDDQRVDRICGFNRLEEYHDISWDYFFSTISSGYGWATWKRNWERIKLLSDYAFLNDTDLVNTYNRSRNIIADRGYGDMMALCRDVKKKNAEKNRVESWETIVGINSLLNHSLVITPRRNMIRNIGATEDALHYAELRYANPYVRKLLTMKAYDIEFPIRHPTCMVRDAHYEQQHYNNTPHSIWKKLAFKVDVLYRHIRYGDFQWFIKKIKKK